MRVDTTLGNIASALVGSYRKLSGRHAPRALAGLEHRNNRRHDLAALISRIGWAAARTPPMPYRLPKLAEDHG